MSNVLTLRKLLTLRIELIGSEPLIWRRLEIDESTNLVESGLAIQIAMGWEHGHMQSFGSEDPFTASRPLTGIEWFDESMRDESGYGEPQETTTLGQALKVAAEELFYVYDFGDGWMHRITVESRGSMDIDDPKYKVLDGQLRAPLEDSGGLGGWSEKLGIFRSAQRSAEEEEIVSWMNWSAGPWKEFDPLAFDIDFANARLTLLNVDFVGTNAAGRWAAQFHEGIRRYLSLVFAHCQVGLEPTGGEIPEWFLDIISPFYTLVHLCTEQDVVLSKAGWMPPAIVAELVKRCDLAGIDFESGKLKRENNMPSLARIRDCVTDLKLIRKYKGKLIPTKMGSSLAQDPQAMAEFIIESLRAVANKDVYVDATFSEWVIRAGGYRPDKFGYGGEPVKNYVDVSEILANFGYYDPDTQGPVSRATYIPCVEPWFNIGRLIDFRYPRREKGEEKDLKLQQISRFILEA